MKKKMFTLLLAMVTVVVFQAKAQDPDVNYWILADTTGLLPNSNPRHDDRYPYNKLDFDADWSFKNWFTATGGSAKVHSVDTNAIYKDLLAKFKVNKVNGVGGRYTLTPLDGTPISFEYGVQKNYDFEIVQFNNGATYPLYNPNGSRLAQIFQPDGHIEGYLSVGQGVSVINPYDPDLLLVGTDDKGNISIKKFSEWAAISGERWTLNEVVATQPTVTGNQKKDTVPGRLYLATTGPKYLAVYANNVVPGLNRKEFVSDFIGAPPSQNIVDFNSGAGTAYAYYNLTIKDSIISANGYSVSIQDIYRYTLSQGYQSFKTVKRSDLVTSADSANFQNQLFIKPLAGNELGVSALYKDGVPFKFDLGSPTSYILNGAQTYFYFNVWAPLFADELSDLFEHFFKIYLGMPDPALVTPDTTGIYYNLKGTKATTWRPLYVYITPACEVEKFLYVDREWLADEYLDLTYVNQKIHTPMHPDVYVASENGYATLSNDKNKAVDIMFEYTGDILLNTPLNGASFKDTTVTHPITIPSALNIFFANQDLEVFFIKNSEGKYLTILDESEYYDVNNVTPWLANGVQLGWKDKYKFEQDTLFDKRSLQLFAVLRTGMPEKDSLEYQDPAGTYHSFIYQPLFSHLWNPGNKKFLKADVLADTTSKTAFQTLIVNTYAPFYSAANITYATTVLANIIAITPTNDELFEKIIWPNLFVGFNKNNTCNDPRINLQYTWFVSQYSQPGANQKLVVADPVWGGFTRLYLDLIKPKFFEIPCETFLIKNLNKREIVKNAQGEEIYPSTNYGKYYTFDGGFWANADEATLAAHWSFNPSDSSFVAEADSLCDDNQTVSGKRYYRHYQARFVDNLGLSDYSKFDRTAYVLQSVDTIWNANQTVKAYQIEIVSGDYLHRQRDTVQIECIGHIAPYKNIDDYVGGQVAFLESVFKDRNITNVNPQTKGYDAVWKDWYSKYPVFGLPLSTGESYKGNHKSDINADKYPIDGAADGYKTYVNDIPTGQFTESVKRLNVYKSNERYLDLKKNHLVPYYVFSIKKGNNEYFLRSNGAHLGDSVYWTKLTVGQRDTLLNYEKFPLLYRDYKYCLPYKDGKIPAAADEEVFYLQSLETECGLIRGTFLKIGADSKLVTQTGLDIHKNVFYNYQSGYSNFYNGGYGSHGIYGINYSAIDPDKVTTWVVSEPEAEYEWVNIKDATAVTGDSITTGVFTSAAHNYLIGNLFIAPSDASPVDYAVLKDVNKDVTLTVKFRGDTLIGYSKRAIWYYNIITPDGKYLTDALDSAAYTGVAPLNPNYKNYRYYYNTDQDANSFVYAYFGGERPATGNYFEPKVLGDDPSKIGTQSPLLQTFGLKYYNTDPAVNPLDGLYTFVIVSNANYKSYKPQNFRYLGEVNNRLIFVDNIEDALVLQYGTKNGGYTDIEAVAATNLYGVVGGIKVVNATGKVDVYSIDGRLISSSNITSAETTIAVPAGIYVVKNGVKAVKVVVK
jgi:hypothetical protein